VPGIHVTCSVRGITSFSAQREINACLFMVILRRRTFYSCRRIYNLEHRQLSELKIAFKMNDKFIWLFILLISSSLVFLVESEKFCMENFQGNTEYDSEKQR
jgi:hypothetical protein